MNGPKVNEAEKLRREVLIRVGDGLRDHYGHVLKEDMPNRLTGLLRRLVAPNEAGWKEHQ